MTVAGGGLHFPCIVDLLGTCLDLATTASFSQAPVDRQTFKVVFKLERPSVAVSTQLKRALMIICVRVCTVAALVSRGPGLSPHPDFSLAAMHATAVDLPPELVDLIVGIFTFTESITRSPEERGIKKRSLSLCSLTCRYWASRCRPLIFSHTILRCLKDFQTLSTFSTVVRGYVRDLGLEDTAGSVPWTHMVYAFVGQGGLSTSVNVVHTLNGACTPTSVQTLHSLYRSLPLHPPNYIQDDFPLIIENFRLQSFIHIVDVVRKLWGMMHWQVTFRNVSWLSSPSFLPTVLSTKNRGVCDRVELRDCPERWPFVWICISTRQPQPQPNGPAPCIPFLHPEEAVRLAELFKCLTSSITNSGPRCCAYSLIDSELVTPSI